MKKLEYQHSSGVPYSKELSDEEKNFIISMSGYKETAQMPMLVDKICVLKNGIKKLNKSTTIFSIILSIFALIQIIVMLTS